MRQWLLTAALAALLASPTAFAQLARRGGGAPLHMQNRTVPANYNHAGNLNNTHTYNANVNRNVNVNQNVNVNRNVNVHGGACYNCSYHDNDWNWGSFAAGAATTAVVAAATRPAATVVVPSPGAVVSALPGGCASVSSAGTVLYNCSNVYYRPYYQGTTLVYQVVTQP